MKSVRVKILAIFIAFVFAIRRFGRPAAGGWPPRYPWWTPHDFDPELFEFRTDDGLTLRGKRYPNPGGTPLICIAGFSGNGFHYDLAFDEYNFALYMARRGYDVWVANLRGTGRWPYKSDGGDFSHSIDTVAVYDVTALVSGVTQATGKKPVIAGHSMGGVVCYGYLQGVEYVEENGTKRLVPDPELAAERNSAVAGVLALAAPVCFRWPNDSKFYWMIEMPISNLLLRAVRALVRLIERRASQVPVEYGVTTLLEVAPRLGYVLLRVFLYFFANLRNLTPQMFLETAVSGSSDVSFKEAYQMVDAFVTRDFYESASLAGFSGEPHDFTGSMHLVTAPILFVTGDLDAVHPKTVYRYGFEKVSSDVKGYRCFANFGHIDLLNGLEAPARVFPFIADWLDRLV